MRKRLSRSSPRVFQEQVEDVVGEGGVLGQPDVVAEEEGDMLPRNG